MVIRNKYELEAAAYDEKAKHFAGHENNATDFIGRDSSALSLDGRSLIVPNYGDVDDMSSLGATSKYTYRGEGGSPVGYIGDMRIVERAGGANTNPSAMSSLEKKLSAQYSNDPATQYEDYERIYNDSLKTTKEKDVELSKSFEEKKHEEEEALKSDCVPLWITEAPLWLKLIIISSIALLLGALVLIAVGAQLSSEAKTSLSPPEQNSTDSSFSTPLQGNMSSIQEAGPKVIASITTELPSVAPSYAIESPMENISEYDAEVSIGIPLNTSRFPTTASPTVASTQIPTQSPTVSTINFFVMGGRFDGEDSKILASGLRSLPRMDENTILVHLGDWNSPYTTSCSEDSFISNVDSYQQSSVPVYFVPGDNEYNDCPNPTQALGFWNQYLLDFETKYWDNRSWDVIRQSPDYGENFAFLQREILFVGINLVGGIIHDQEEWEARHEADLLWIDTTAAKYDGNYTTLVVFAHADPEIEINQNFFKKFYPMVESYDEQVIFVHRNLGIDTWKKEAEYNGIPNLDVVAVEGSKWPPMWVQIDPISGTYNIDQSTWYEDYISSGMLPPSP